MAGNNFIFHIKRDCSNVDAIFNLIACKHRIVGIYKEVKSECPVLELENL